MQVFKALFYEKCFISFKKYEFPHISGQNHISLLKLVETHNKRSSEREHNIRDYCAKRKTSDTFASEV
jgi:hypothetical protein